MNDVTQPALKMQLIGLQLHELRKHSVLYGFIDTTVTQGEADNHSLVIDTTAPAVFRVDQSASPSMNDGAVEARRQLPGGPLLTAGCTSCKRSTVGVTPESVREWSKIETRPH